MLGNNFGAICAFILIGAVSAQYEYNQGSNDGCCEEYCYMKDEQRYLYYGSKTAYQFAYGKRSNQHIVPQCRPIQLWSFNRHGTRLPSRDKILRLQKLTKVRDDIVRNYEERRSYPDQGKLCNEDLQLFNRWQWNNSVSIDQEHRITSSGLEELKFLARRYQTRFRELLTATYSPGYYSFKYSDQELIHDSYQAYIEGLFGTKSFQVHSEIEGRNDIGPNSQVCDVTKYKLKDEQRMKFEEQQEYKELVKNVFRRLGFRYNLEPSIIDDMYDMCRYETAWNINRPSTWCSAFTHSQLKLLEYKDDLINFYESGYGNEISEKVGCKTLKDLYERLDRTANGDQNEPKVIIRFSNSNEIQQLFAAMGIAKDYTPLTAQNYYTQSRRQWRESLINPFTSNLVAVLYECEQGERNRVMFFLNENPLDYPGCSVGLCSWQMIKEKFRKIVENCNANYCAEGGGSSLNPTYIALSVFLFVLFRI